MAHFNSPSWRAPRQIFPLLALVLAFVAVLVLMSNLVDRYWTASIEARNASAESPKSWTPQQGNARRDADHEPTEPVNGSIALDPDGGVDPGYRALESKIEQMSAQLSELAARTEQQEMERRLARAEMAELREAANDPYLRQQYGKAVSLQQERQVQIVEEQFISEVPDPRWAPETADSLELALADSSTSFARVLDLQCRTSMCRVDLAVPPESAGFSADGPLSATEEPFQVDIALLSALSTDMARSTVRREPDEIGGYTYRIYLYRNGYQPPEAHNPMRGKTPQEIRWYLENL
jgi:outer membrane murein-binding lipoprotein Lpp